MIGTMKALISEYTVQPHESWSAIRHPSDRRLGEVKIRRVSSDGADKWGVFNAMSDRLRRNALVWRRKHPCDALVHPSDVGVGAAQQDRAVIADAFHYEPMVSSRSDAWINNHTFTLAEAMFVCGADVEQESGEGDGV